VAFLLWTYVIDRLPAGVAGLGTLAVPVIGMTGSRLQLGEQIAFWEGWGIALIVAALALLSIMRLRENRKENVVPGQD
jgi:drug/metabolite transporter (DMT)-like permease